MRMSVTISTAVAIAVALAPGVGAEPRSPEKPRAPKTTRFHRQETKPAMSTGLMSLGSVVTEPGPEPAPKKVRTAAAAAPTPKVRTAARKPEPVLTRYVSQRESLGSGDGVSARVARAWPGDDRKALRVVNCESRFNPQARSDSGKYGGLWQFDQRTWRSVGGAGSPRDASVEEQTYRAWRLRQQRGWNPWPTCGRR